jgi:hypothetical protein
MDELPFPETITLTNERRRSMDKYRLLGFFHELIKLGIDMPGRPGFGSPISWLLEQMCVRQEKFIGRILGDRTRESTECRLNNAGLKMHWWVDDNKFKVYISGDQVRDYPGFCVAAGKLIKKYGYNHR